MSSRPERSELRDCGAPCGLIHSLSPGDRTVLGLLPGQLFNKFPVSRINTNKLRSRGQFKILKLEPRRHGATHQRKPRRFLQSRCKPTSRFHHRLKSFAGIGAQVQFRCISFRIDHVHDQTIPCIEVPHLIGSDAMECRKVLSLKQKINGGRRRAIPAEGRGQSTPGNRQVCFIGGTIVSALGVRAEFQVIDPVLRVPRPTYCPACCRKA